MLRLLACGSPVFLIIMYTLPFLGSWSCSSFHFDVERVQKTLVSALFLSDIYRLYSIVFSCIKGNFFCDTSAVGIQQTLHVINVASKSLLMQKFFLLMQCSLTSCTKHLRYSF
jgi:hypothetical protein